ncbi:MAG: helix-turn-helix domain-containing protein [Thermoanaerobaculia bacterium]
MPRKERKPPSPEALALLYMRSERGWTQRKLADRLGLTDHTQISSYERGGKPLHRERLVSVAAVLGYPPEAVDALLRFNRWLQPSAPAEPASPVALTPGERRSLDRTVLAATEAFLEEIRKELIRKKRERKADAARRKARDLWLRLKAAPRQDQRDLVTVMPALQDWALAVHVCEASVRAAAHRPEDALYLADLAVLIAARSPGPQGWRSRLEGYCWAHLANARRVASDFSRADKAFVQAWKLWRAGASSDSNLLPEWRLLDLEASLRRDERRFQEALELLDRAIATNRINKPAAAQILLNKEFIFDQIGDLQGALTALLQAAPLVEASGNNRLLFALRFKIANNLCQLGRCGQASKQLPQVRELAEQLGNELDLIRVLWLEARLAAKQGETAEAITNLEQVRRDFTARGVPYDAALASLELAVLYLQEERLLEVQKLARTLTWIFQAHGIAREALASLTLFSDAALRKTVTVELVQRIIADLESQGPRPLLRLSNGKAEGKDS